MAIISEDENQLREEARKAILKKIVESAGANSPTYTKQYAEAFGLLNGTVTSSINTK